MKIKILLTLAFLTCFNSTILAANIAPTDTKTIDVPIRLIKSKFKDQLKETTPIVANATVSLGGQTYKLLIGFSTTGQIIEGNRMDGISFKFPKARDFRPTLEELLDTHRSEIKNLTMSWIGDMYVYTLYTSNHKRDGLVTLSPQESPEKGVTMSTLNVNLIPWYDEK